VADGRRKLLKLAAHSFVSLTPVPLYIFGSMGVFITLAALLLGSLADWISPPAAVLVSSLMMVAFGALILMQPSWRNWQMQPATTSSPEINVTEAAAEFSHV